MERKGSVGRGRSGRMQEEKGARRKGQERNERRKDRMEKQERGILRNGTGSRGEKRK